MRVVSQDRTLSVDFEGNIFRCEDNYIYVHIDSADKSIAKYDSTKRAYEVFSEMHDKYMNEMKNLPYVTVFGMPKE